MSNTISSWFIPFWYSAASGENTTPEMINNKREELKAKNELPSFPNPRALTPAKTAAEAMGILAIILAGYAILRKSILGAVVGTGALVLAVVGWFADRFFVKNPTNNNTENNNKPIEDPIWDDTKFDHYSDKEGTYLWWQSSKPIEISRPNEYAAASPLAYLHKLFQMGKVSPGTLMVYFDPKGKLSVCCKRLNAKNIDARGRNINIASVSPNSHLTDNQKKLLKAVLSSDPNTFEGTYDEMQNCGLSSVLKLTTAQKENGREYDCMDIIGGTEGFTGALTEWANSGMLPKPDQQIVQEIRSGKMFINTAENRSALLSIILELDGKGELKQSPGDVIAVIGNKINNDVNRLFKPRWILRNSGDIREY